MTLLSTTPKEINNGNGSTVSWDFSFKINKAADLKVITTDSDGVETERTEGTGTTNYSVSVTSYPGTGSITYPATLGTKLATGEKITLERIVTIEQQTDLVNKGRYDPSQVEDALDLSRMVDLQLQSRIDRCLKIAASDNSGITVELPSETVRASKVLGFDSAGNVSMMTIEGVKANYAATTAPTSGDDSADGYSVGSKWFDATNDLTYECVDASAGAAVWVEIVGRTLTQLLTNKTVQGFKFADTSNDHQYTVTVSELAANRNILLPLLTGNDEFVFKDHAVTLTNKTIDGDNNTISNLAHGAEVDEPSSGVHGVTGSIVGTTDAQTLTNKTVDLASNTLTGTTDEFNAALSDGSFATLEQTPFKNFVIDGDFTQWPEGTSFSSVSASQYASALVNHVKLGSSPAVWTYSRSTDVPTYAQSGHNSLYSLSGKVTTADAAIAAADGWSHEYVITGYDYQSLHQREITVSFWFKFIAGGGSGLSAPYTFSLYLQNSARNRSHVANFTVSADSTWEKITKTITLDSTGTWELDADAGLRFGICLGAGANYQGTVDTWEGADDRATSSTDNGHDATDNEFRIAQMQINIGDTALPFYQPTISTVEQNVEYYIQKWGLNNDDVSDAMFGGVGNGASQLDVMVMFRSLMRASPTMTATDGDTWQAVGLGGGSASAVSFAGTKRAGTRMMIPFGGTLTANASYNVIAQTATCEMIADARH